jgi:hypothetical protein
MIPTALGQLHDAKTVLVEQGTRPMTSLLINSTFFSKTSTVLRIAVTREVSVDRLDSAL